MPDHYLQKRCSCGPNEACSRCIRQPIADQQTSPFALCERTVQRCIEALPKRDACAQPGAFIAALDQCHDALSALLPDPRRKKMEEAIVGALRASDVKWDSEDLRLIVDAAMVVEK